LLWQESKGHALTPIQIQVLIFLNFHSREKCKVSYLAKEFNMAKATISETIKILELKKLITKEFIPSDTRSYIILLTNKGKDIAEKTSFFSTEIFKPIDQLNPDDKEIMLLSLLDIIRHLNRRGVITIQRMCLTCKYYQSSDNETHFCHLLNQKLNVSDLRIDCPEHVEQD
jgi:DNA-binding MarR family transcriptional regulator